LHDLPPLTLAKKIAQQLSTSAVIISFFSDLNFALICRATVAPAIVPVQHLELKADSVLSIRFFLSSAMARETFQHLKIKQDSILSIPFLSLLGE